MSSWALHSVHDLDVLQLFMLCASRGFLGFRTLQTLSPFQTHISPTVYVVPTSSADRSWIMIHGLQKALCRVSSGHGFEARSLNILQLFGRYPAGAILYRLFFTSHSCLLARPANIDHISASMLSALGISFLHDTTRYESQAFFCSPDCISSCSVPPGIKYPRKPCPCFSSDNHRVPWLPAWSRSSN